MRLALVLPGVAIGFVAVVILGPGNAKPVLGARVFIAPWENDRIPSARIAAVWRLGDAETPAPDVELQLEVGERRIDAKTGADGVADVSIRWPALKGTAIAVRTAGATLAQGALDFRNAVALDWEVPEARRGEGLFLGIEPVRGQLAPPFVDKVAIVASDGGQRNKKVHVVVELTGASPAKIEGDVGTREGPLIAEVTPEALRVDFEAKALGEEGAVGRMTGSLPTVPGAIWLDPSSPPDRLDIVAPAPRKAAYVSFWTESGRIGGATVPLREDAVGFHRGSVPRPEMGDDRTLDLVVSGDADEMGPATVMWPVVQGKERSRVPWGSGQIVPRLRRIIDGAPDATAAEQARVTRVRRLAIAVAFIVGVLEIFLLFLEGRRAQNDLDAHFIAQANAADGVEDGAAIRHVATSAAKSGNVMVTILGAMIAVAFGIVAAFVAAR